MARPRSAARFVASAPVLAVLPDVGLPEVAFAGRSNVGKSSLIGMLLGQPGLVRSSRTPGRTQHLNLFVFEERLAVVDMPGYGYAKLSKTQRAHMSALIASYLDGRQALRGVVLVLDARREEVSPLDVETAHAVTERHIPLLVAVTKVDLVPKNRLRHQVARIERSLGTGEGALLCSAVSGDGRRELVARLEELIKWSV